MRPATRTSQRAFSGRGIGRGIRALRSHDTPRPARAPRQPGPKTARRKRPRWDITPGVEIDQESCLAAFLGRDRRFAGRFYAGRDVDRHLLPSRLPGPPAETSKRPLLPLRGRRRGSGLPRLPPLSPRDGARDPRLDRHVGHRRARPAADRGGPRRRRPARCARGAPRRRRAAPAAAVRRAPRRVSRGHRPDAAPPFRAEAPRRHVAPDVRRGARGRATPASGASTKRCGPRSASPRPGCGVRRRPPSRRRESP